MITDPSIQTRKEKRKFKMKVPSSITTLFLIMVLVMVVSWIMMWSGATFEGKNDLAINLQDVLGSQEGGWTISETWLNANNITNQEVINSINEALKDHNFIVDGTFTYTLTTIEKVKAAGIMELFTGIFHGFAEKVDIIVFVLAIGAFSFIVFETKALDAMTYKITKKMGKKTIFLIPVMVLFLSFCGSAYGMCDEAIPFYVIMIPLMLASGFDKMTAIMTILLGVGVGPLAATFDPFVIQTASEATNAGAGETIVGFSDGLAWRFVIWFVLTTFTAGYIMIYAHKTHKTPEKSVTFGTYEEDKVFYLSEQREELEFTTKRKIVASLYFIGFLVMIIYMFAWQEIFNTTGSEDMTNWINTYIPYLSGMMGYIGSGSMLDVSGIFLLFALIVGLMSWQDEEHFAKTMVNGVRDFMGVACVLSVAGGVTYLLRETGMQGAISGAASGMSDMNPYLFIVMSYIIFIPISLAIPSTSGFASAIFPVWGPLAGNITVYGAQGAANSITMASGSITAFGMANGWANMFSPTSGIVVGAITFGKINYATLFKGIGLYLIAVFVISILLLITGVAVNGTGNHLF